MSRLDGGRFAAGRMVSGRFGAGRFGQQSVAAVAAQIITASTAPVLAALTDAQTPADGVTAGSYASSAGTISSQVVTYLVDGVSELGSFDLTAGDVVQISELVTDSAANTRAFAAGPVTVTPSVALSNTVAPAITGTANVGQTLGLTAGTWAGSAARTFSYQWTRGGVDIAGATSSTYTLTATDDQTNVGCDVSATDGFTTVDVSTATVAVTYAAPVATGGLADQTYTQSTGDQTVDASGDFTGAAGGSWGVVGGGATIDASGVVTIPTDSLLSAATVTVTYTNSGGSDSSAFSVTVQAAGDTTAPVLSGVSYDEVDTITMSLSEAATVYYLVDDNATRTAAQVEAGGGLRAGSYAVTTGANSDAIDFSGVSAGNHYLHIMAKDAAGNQSIVDSTQYTFAGTVPSAFVDANWSIADAGTGGDADVTIASLPTAGSDTITDVEYKIGAGAWTSSGGTTSFSIADGFTDGVSTGVMLRAVSAAGNGADGNTENVTTSAPADVTAPTLSSTSPADNATGVAITINPTLTFSENIAFGTGNIVLRVNNGGWSDLEVFDVTVDTGGGAGTVSISGAVLTIEPTADLSNSLEYAIRIDATAIDDTATSPNSFAGIADDTTVSFTTVASGGALTGAASYTYTAEGTDSATAAAVTLTPTEGDWIVAVVSERSGIGIAGHTISDSNGGTWAAANQTDSLVADASFRHSSSIFVKTASATDATGMTITGGVGGSASCRLTAKSITPSSPLTWGIGQVASASSGSADWVGVPSGNITNNITNALILSVAVCRNASGSDKPQSCAINRGTYDRAGETVDNGLTHIIGIETTGQAPGTYNTVVSETGGETGNEGIMVVISAGGS